MTTEDLLALNSEEIRAALLRLYKTPIESLPKDLKNKLWAASKKYCEVESDRIEYCKALSVLIEKRYENS